MRSPGYKGLIAALLAVTLSGACIREDLPECITVYELYVRVASAANYAAEALPEMEVDTATAFIFDDRGILYDVVGLGSEALRNEMPVKVAYRGAGRPGAVVWGNLENCEVTPPLIGETSIGDIMVKIPPGEGGAAATDNLYYAASQLTMAGRQDITIIPAMGRLTITARGLEREPGEQYFFSVETRIEGYDFYRASLPGDRILKVGAARAGARDDLTIGDPLPLFVYPENNAGLEPIKVSLYRVTNGQQVLVGQTEIDDTFLDIIPQAGHRVNVLMNFGLANDFSVVVRITDWDEVEQWEEW